MPDGHPAVLRFAPFRDVEFTHDLQAGDQPVLDAFRGTLHFVQHPVNAVAHPDFVFGGLDVDVRGEILDRLTNQQVDEADDRNVVVGGTGVRFRAGVGLGALFFQGVCEVGQLAIRTQGTVQGGQQVPALGDDDVHRQIGGRPDVIDGKDVSRVPHCEGHPPASDGERKHLVPAADGCRNPGYGRAVDFGKEQLHEGHAGLDGADPGDLCACHRAIVQKGADSRGVVGAVGREPAQPLERQHAFE